MYLYDNTGTLNGSYASGTTNSLSEAITDHGTVKKRGPCSGRHKTGKWLFSMEGENSVDMDQAPDEIRHVAVSGDGSIVLAADRTNVFAFLLGSSAPASPTYYQYIPKNQTPGSPDTSSLNTTPLPTKTRVPTTITELPTTYSIIRTPTQSPSSVIILACSLVLALIVLSKKK